MSKSGDQTPQPPSHIPVPRSRRGPRAFFSDVNRELRRVNWPPIHETNRLTGVVLAVCTLLVLILTVMHLVFEQLIKVITRGF